MFPQPTPLLSSKHKVPTMERTHAILKNNKTNRTISNNYLGIQCF